MSKLDTRELTTRLRELHVLDPRRSARTLSQRCLTCFEEWPCERSRLLDHIESLEKALAKSAKAAHSIHWMSADALDFTDCKLSPSCREATKVLGQS